MYLRKASAVGISAQGGVPSLIVCKAGSNSIILLYRRTVLKHTTRHEGGLRSEHALHAG